jgi:hypothetical protein
VQTPPADFCKNTSDEKNSNSPLKLEIQKIKYANLSVIGYKSFLFKINRLFLIRDANFRMNQKKNPSNTRFSTFST